MADKKDSSDMNYEVHPAMPENMPPPPSYEEVLGQYVTSVQHGQSSLPTLAYIDIMPRLLNPGNIKERMQPTFQTFDQLVIGANLWLRDNPGLSVWKCENVERKVMPGHTPATVNIDLESMLQHEATFGSNCFVFGLRLWLTPKSENQKGVQELGVINVLPLKKEIDVTVHCNTYHGARRFMRHGGFGMRGMGISQKQTMITYEGLKKSLAAFNENTKSTPIPGTILNIESTTLKFAEGIKETTIEEAANTAMWFETDGQSSKRYTQIMRIFYVKGTPTTPEICMKEFLPQQMNNPRNAFQAIRFDTFSSVVQQAALWVQQQAGIQIANIETRHAEVGRLFNQVQVDTDSTDHFEYGLRTATKLRYLRVFYTANPSVAAFAHTAVSSRLFVPMSLGGAKFETMTQTMARIDAWMRTTGLPIFGVETVSFLKEGVSGSSQERCDFSVKPFSSKHWVNTIRVYFPSNFQEPYPNPFPPQLQVQPGAQTSSCNIL